MRLSALQVLYAALLALAGLTAAHGQVYETPPGVSAVFSDPAIEAPQLSPDGTRLLFIRRPQPGNEDPDTAFVFIVDYTDLENPAIHRLPADADGLRWAAWGNDDRILISLRTLTDIDGAGALVYDESGALTLIRQAWRTVLFAINADGTDSVQLLDQNRRRLSLYQTRGDQVVDFLPDDPDHILLAVRSARGALNVHRVNINTGDGRRIDSGRDETLAWFTNSQGVSVMRLDASTRWDRVFVLIRERDGQRWRRVSTQTMSEFSEFQDGIDWVGRSDSFDEALVLTRAEGSDTLGLHRYSLTEGVITEPVFDHGEYDIQAVRVDPFTGRALALAWAAENTYVEVFDPVVERHLNALREFFGDEVVVEPIQRAASRILIDVSGPLEPRSYYLYDIESFNVVPIGAQQPALQNTGLASVSVHHYTARDGTNLFGYLTHPINTEPGPLPLVVLPHGGPEARDYNQFDSLAQLVAAEGFLVFQPQFRGSSGFGEQFALAGHGEWGGLIQRDISDGTRSLISAGLIDPDRICVAGWSFGGYSALMQAILEPELYRCAAAGAPVTDLPELLAWKEGEIDEPSDRLRSMLGYPDTERMAHHSPARRAEEIKIPLILVHGNDDQIVPIEQSRLMAESLEAAGIEPELLEFSGGHALNEPSQMRTAMFHITRFLSQHLDTDYVPKDVGEPVALSEEDTLKAESEAPE